MSERRRAPGFLTEDLHPVQVGGPSRYTSRTDRPVDYLAIADRDDVLLGYFYANDADGAAGWVARPAAGAAAYNLTSRWVRTLHDGKARGLPPTAALDEMIRAGVDSADDPRSHVVSAERQRAANLAELEAMAGD